MPREDEGRRREGRTVLFVSHNMAAVEELAFASRASSPWTAVTLQAQLETLLNDI